MSGRTTTITRWSSRLLALRRRALAAVLPLLATTAVAGSVVDFAGQPLKKISASGHTVDIFPRARIALASAKAPVVVNLTGAGIREKKILIVSANVYVLTSYSDLAPKEFVANPTKAIADGSVEMLQLTLLRDLSAEKIRDSFSSALEENDISVKSPAMKAIFANLNQDVKEGSVITIISQKREKGDETLYFLGIGKAFSVTGKGLGTDFWKIWFGKPADSGLENLQKELTHLS